MLTYERARELWTPDFEAGTLRWKERPLSDFATARICNWWNTKYAHTIAGTPSNGYSSVFYNTSQYKAHRVLWLLRTKTWPIEIDHINGDPQDNRITNLREVPRTINMQNKALYASNTSGIPGVGWHKNSGTWVARITNNKKRKHLGCFKFKHDAVIARKQAETKYNFHINHGRRAKQTKGNIT